MSSLEAGRLRDLLCPLLTSALRSNGLGAASVAEATQSRSPEVSSAAFCAQSPNLRFASLMEMDFAIRCSLVRRSRLVSGSCPSTRTFDPCFFQTPPRGGSPCILSSPSPPSGWAGTFTLKLLNMLSTQQSRWAADATRSLPLRLRGPRDGLALSCRYSYYG